LDDAVPGTGNGTWSEGTSAPGAPRHPALRSSPEPSRLSEETTTGNAVHIFAEHDVPAVAALFARAYPHRRWASQAACESYFREMFFCNPWRDPELPSWVAKDDGGIFGFYGVMPRPMLFRGRPIRTAVICQAMVDPERRGGLTTVQLVKACLSGPQDLTLADGAHERWRRLWLGIGGTAPLLYSLHWIRPLRPARYVLQLLQKRAAAPSALTLAARPLGALADALAARARPNRFYREQDGLAEEPLDAATVLAHLPSVFDGSALRPVYDESSLAWLLEQTARMRRHGTLRARAVLDDARRVIGWYLYYALAGGVSEVVQVAACNGSFDRVLQRLLADAWRQGAVAVRGRLDPRYTQELSDRHCWLRRDGSATLIHSRHADVLASIEQGDAFLSRLEGEWWLRWTDAENVGRDVTA
jgi:hypothetical protein